MKPIPERGDKLVLTCRNCNKPNLMQVTSVKKNGLNANTDGSWCYKLKARCHICDYVNGQYRPIWYNFYELGSIDY